MATTGIAERITFGRPARADEVAPVRVAPRPTTALVGRFCIAAIFVLSGVAKLTDTSGTVQHMVGAGIPDANYLVYIAAAAEICGGLAIMFGFLTRLAAGALIVYLAITTLAFHHFWNLTGVEQKTQMINFMKNLSIMGGLAILLASGAGRFSIDAKIRKPIEP